MIFTFFYNFKVIVLANNFILLIPNVSVNLLTLIIVLFNKI